MGYEAFFPSVGEKLFFNDGAALYKFAIYFYARQFIVKRVMTVSLSNRQRIVKKFKKVHYLLNKLSHQSPQVGESGLP